MQQRPTFWHSVTRPAVIATALHVALLVGTCLNLINQGAAVWHGAAIDWPRLGLNYLVPFCVSAFSGARATRITEE
ncbi:nitrate/nitrite transporter NrtS [Sphingorhabdus sp.]|uniref:nitrate/nitrite transporter NrtS n=1 Tax=Sphingorhabdus sp. TaxID=1902408 RepID=UPI0032B745E3